VSLMLRYTHLVSGCGRGLTRATRRLLWWFVGAGKRGKRGNPQDEGAWAVSSLILPA
jgi:hypothetical protein